MTVFQSLKSAGTFLNLFKSNLSVFKLLLRGCSHGWDIGAGGVGVELFLVRIFLFLDWMRGFAEWVSVFGPGARGCGPGIAWYVGNFRAVLVFAWNSALRKKFNFHYPSLKSLGNSWGNSYIPSLLLIMTLHFTCGDRKIW